MSELSHAVKLAERAEQAQRDINNFLAPFAKAYGEFLTEENPRGYDLRDFNSDTFIEVENNTFYLKGEEDYSYGDYYTPSLSLPFAFVEDPQQFKNDYRQKQAEAKAKAAAKTAKDKAERVARLKTQLAKAQAELDKALGDGSDDIKAVAYTLSEKRLLSELANTIEQD
jgi:hypothetical protein